MKGKIMANTKQTIESIKRIASVTDEVTAYSISVMINAKLQEAGYRRPGEDKVHQIRPQMMYNYDRNGLIVKGKKHVCVYTWDEAVTFVTKYLKKFEIDFEATVVNEIQEALDALQDEPELEMV